MLSLTLTWIMLSVGYAGGFLDLDELKNVYYGIDISDTPLLHPSVCKENRCLYRPLDLMVEIALCPKTLVIPVRC